MLADEAARELLQHFGRLADAIPIEGASSEVQQFVQQVRRIASRPPSTAPPQHKLKRKHHDDTGEESPSTAPPQRKLKL